MGTEEKIGRGEMLTTYLLLLSRLRIRGTITLLPLYALMACAVITFILAIRTVSRYTVAGPNFV
jgi:hypothetical protein